MANKPLPKSLQTAIETHADAVYDAFVEDGSYWVYLRPGWIVPSMECGTIHESTAKDAIRMLATIERTEQ